LKAIPHCSGTPVPEELAAVLVEGCEPDVVDPPAPVEALDPLVALAVM
jgi:hypothetical protein